MQGTTQKEHNITTTADILWSGGCNRCSHGLIIITVLDHLRTHNNKKLTQHTFQSIDEKKECALMSSMPFSPKPKCKW